jgi:hypothetical protein
LIAGGAAPLWTKEEDDWLIVHTMYNKDLKWLAENLPGENSRTPVSISGRLGNMREAGKLPKNWTVRASNYDCHPWNIEEDMELMRWYAHDRKFIDAVVFIENNRSGTAAYTRAKFLLEDPELGRKATEIENRQRNILLEGDLGGDTKMSGAETVEEERGSKELRLAVMRSLAVRPAMVQ